MQQGCDNSEDEYEDLDNDPWLVLTNQEHRESVPDYVDIDDVFQLSDGYGNDDDDNAIEYVDHRHQRGPDLGSGELLPHHGSQRHDDYEGHCDSLRSSSTQFEPQTKRQTLRPVEEEEEDNRRAIISSLRSQQVEWLPQRQPVGLSTSGNHKHSGRESLNLVEKGDYDIDPSEVWDEPTDNELEPWESAILTAERQAPSSSNLPSRGQTLPSMGLLSGQYPCASPSGSGNMASLPTSPSAGGSSGDYFSGGHLTVSPSAVRSSQFNSYSSPTSKLPHTTPLLAGGQQVAQRSDGSGIEDDWYGNIKRNCQSITQFNRNHPFLRSPFSKAKFQRWFNHYMQEYNRTQDKSYVHAMLVSVMLHTLRACHEGYYTYETNLTPDGQGVHQLDRNSMLAYARKSTYYGQNHHFAFNPTAARPYSNTIVEVLSMDTVEAGVLLQKAGYRPALLNLASRTSPGGGFRHGHWAQEECLTRRSNYYQHLSQLDDLCPQRSWSYPMEHVGGIYSHKVCFFRGTEQDGYPFLEKPVYFDCIAVAAYRKPPVVDGRLEENVARSTRLKIKRIFQIALEENCNDSLVLGALGCGAFQNPANHIAELFHDVIQEFAGCFSKIVFAIVADHNAQANFHVFKNKLESVYPAPRPGMWGKLNRALFGGQKLQHQHQRLQNDENTQPQTRGPKEGKRVLSSTSDSGPDAERFSPISLSRTKKEPCKHGGSCTKLDNEEHRRKWAHPPFCRDGGLCPKRDDMSHLQNHIHPPPCRYRGLCTEFDDDHMRKYLHPIDCRHGDQCHNNEAQHLIAYRHAKKRCRDEWSCCQMKDVDHTKKFSHMIKPPCRYYESCREMDNEDHMKTFSHRCWWGTQCDKLRSKNSKHNSMYYHIAKKECKHGAKCKRIVDPDHLMQCSHAGIKDILPPCKYGALCRKAKKFEHARKYFHPKGQQFACDVRGYNADIDFVANRDFLFDAVNKWNNNNKLVPPPDIVEWVSHFRPVHRCRKEIFELVMKHGALLSSDFQAYLKIQPAKAISSEINSDAALRNLLHRYRVQMTQGLKALIKQITSAANSGTIPTEQPKIDAEASKLRLDKQFTAELQHRLVTLVNSVKSHENKGILFTVDKQMGTNRHVFSTIGPHTGAYYGDIMFVLSSDVMHHPDFNMTPHAATSFNSGRTFSRRPWIGQKPADVLPIYHRCKLNGSIKDWHVVMAAEIVAQYKVEKGCFPTLAEAQAWYVDATNHDSHFCIEGHLPSLVPLAFVRKVIMPQVIWDSLSNETKALFEKHFPKERKRLMIASTGLPFSADVYRAMVGKPNNERKGYYFALSQSWARPRLMPKITKAKPTYAKALRVEFKALGCEIFVTLSPSDDLTKVGKEVYHIALACGRSCTASIRRGIKKDDRVLEAVTDFNAGYPDGVSVPYRITVNLKGKVTIDHGAAQSCQSPKLLIFRDREPITTLSHVAFSCWNHSVTFSDVLISWVTK